MTDADIVTINMSTLESCLGNIYSIIIISNDNRITYKTANMTIDNVIKMFDVYKNRQIKTYHKQKYEKINTDDNINYVIVPIYDKNDITSHIILQSSGFEISEKALCSVLLTAAIISNIIKS